MCCTGLCGVENTNIESDKLTTGAEGSLLLNENIYVVVLRSLWKTVGVTILQRFFGKQMRSVTCVLRFDAFRPIQRFFSKIRTRLPGEVECYIKSFLISQGITLSKGHIGFGERCCRI